MIKLQDFARDCGVTDRQIQRQLKKYEAELEGHFERKGSNGTWLDDVACELIRSRMKQQPTVVYQDGDGLWELSQELEQAKKELRELDKELRQVYQAKSALETWKAENAMLIAGAEQTRLALEEAKAEQQAQAEEYAQGLAQAAQEAAEAARSAQAAQELAEAEKKAREAAEAEAAALRAELARPLTLKERIFGRKG